MKKQLIILALILLPLGLQAEGKGSSGSAVFSGFSGGMMVHGGYLFASDPSQVFGNTALGGDVQNLPKGGFCMGLGGSLRVHLLNHIHVGAEGFVSTMPMSSMHNGSNVRTGWGGALCDYYTEWGRVRPVIGMTIGGGATKRLYIPDADGCVQVVTTDGDTINYNASYSKTPFFFLDPYVGLEIGLNNHMALIVRIDYLLPFGSSKSILTQNVSMSNFVNPSGPRLYVGVMFGRMKKE